jgi:HK97 family phage portal protein
MSNNLNALFPFLGTSTDQIVTKIAKLTQEQPYQYQVWVYACISLIANNLAGLPRYLHNKRTDEKIESHPILDLFDRANAETFGETFWESVIIHMLLEGQVFLLPDDKQRLGAGRIPRELYVIQDKYMDAKLNNKNIIDKWKYCPNGTTKIPYAIDELIRCRFYNPYDKKKGLAPLQAALFTIYQDANAMSYTANFFKNNAQIGGVLSTGEKLTEEQAKFIAGQFEEKYSGVDKAGKTPILHSGLNYQAISSTFKDMQYKEQQEFIKERILAAFKVPRSLVADYSEVNYSNSITAKKTFWQEGLLPIDSLINEAITYQWISGVNSDWELKSDLSGVEALQEIAGDKINGYKTLVDSGMPREEAARLLNIPVDWDYVEELEEEEEEPEVVEAPPEEEEQNMGDQELDIQAYTKALKSSLNRYFTRLRNKCLDKVDAGVKIDYSVEQEFDAMVEELKGAYLPIITGLISEIKGVSVEAEDIIDFLNKRSAGYKELLTQVNDKRIIHEMFQDMYKLNKSIAERELPLLIDFIKISGDNNENDIQKQNGE